MYGKRQAKRKKYRQQNRGKRAGKPNKKFCPKVKGQNSDDLSWNQTAYRMIIATLDRHINKQGYKFFNPASKFFANYKSAKFNRRRSGRAMTVGIFWCQNARSNYISVVCGGFLHLSTARFLSSLAARSL